MLTAAEIPLMAIRRQIASAVDIIVHLGRLRDRTRKVLEITEVAGFREGEILLNPLFCWEESSAVEQVGNGLQPEDGQPPEEDRRVQGCLKATGSRLFRRDKLERMGIRDEDSSI